MANPNLQARLHRAWSSSDLTLDQLAERAGLGLTKVSMSRKLRGLQRMTTEEAEAIARALRVRISFTQTRL